MSRDIPLIRQNRDGVPCKKITVKNRVEIRLKGDAVIIGSNRLSGQRRGSTNDNDAIGGDVVLDGNCTTGLGDIVVNADI